MRAPRPPIAGLGDDRFIFMVGSFETLKGTGMIFFIAVGAMFFTRFLAFAGVPQFMHRALCVLSSSACASSGSSTGRLGE